MRITINANTNNTKTLYSLLDEQHLRLPQSCNKTGRCGKCSVFIEGLGMTKSCTYIPKKTITVEITSVNPSPNQIKSPLYTIDNTLYQLVNPVLLIDLGTTTTTMVLLNKNGEITKHVTFATPGSHYGVDVLSRIQASNNGYRKDLKELLEASLTHYGTLFCNDAVGQCYLAGNTTMIHLLMGYSCESIATFPFRPYCNESITTHINQWEIYILPSFSAFIGGDVLAGLYSLRFENRNSTCLFVDLGTNGELALLHNNNLVVGSVAAGPAFEAGGLSCGCQGIAGAITDVTLGGIHPQLTTIDNKHPIGICGSGAVNLVAELLRKKFIESNGILTEKFPNDGIFLGKTIQGESLLFTADDLRQVQLALAAIRAGIASLLNNVDIAPKDIDYIYLAGGFGYELNLNTASYIHLFPGECIDNISVIGNSCLAGLRRCAMEGIKPLQTILTKCHEVSFADDKVFKTHLISYTTFE